MQTIKCSLLTAYCSLFSEEDEHGILGMRIYRTAEYPMEEINRLLLPPAADVAEAQRSVDDIVARVRAEGDAAVLELTRQFDWPQATLSALTVNSGRSSMRWRRRNRRWWKR